MNFCLFVAVQRIGQWRRSWQSIWSARSGPAKAYEAVAGWLGRADLPRNAGAGDELTGRLAGRRAAAAMRAAAGVVPDTGRPVLGPGDAGTGR